MELTERKKKVLRSVVDLYIRTAEPVGSKAITALPDMKYSSATIRNEMADLTNMGYLEQPHTSAGRIPSAAGYRLYVDELMMDYRLSMDETKSMNIAIEEKMQKIDNNRSHTKCKVKAGCRRYCNGNRSNKCNRADRCTHSKRYKAGNNKKHRNRILNRDEVKHKICNAFCALSSDNAYKDTCFKEYKYHCYCIGITYTFSH